MNIDFKNGIVKLKITDAQTVKNDIASILINDETIVAAFESVRDRVVFTNCRIIAVNVQGITGTKIAYTSIPYKSVQCFAVETAGTFDRDCELELHVTGLGKVHFEFTSATEILQIAQVIGFYVL